MPSRSPRPKDALILAVIQTPQDRVKANEHVVIPDYAASCRMRAPGSSMAVLKGLDDPKIRQTLKRIQDARLKGKPATQPKAATQPATRPAGP